MPEDEIHFPAILGGAHPPENARPITAKKRVRVLDQPKLVPVSFRLPTLLPARTEVVGIRRRTPQRRAAPVGGPPSGA